MSEKALLPCIHLAQGDIPPRVLVCGDPARAERISKRLTEARCLAQNREYWTYTGLYQGVPVAVVSHGVGSGGAAIAFESLWRAGARVIIRVGTWRSRRAASWSPLRPAGRRVSRRKWCPFLIRQWPTVRW